MAWRACAVVTSSIPSHVEGILSFCSLLVCTRVPVCFHSSFYGARKLQLLGNTSIHTKFADVSPASTVQSLVGSTRAALPDRFLRIRD